MKPRVIIKKIWAVLLVALLAPSLIFAQQLEPIPKNDLCAVSSEKSVQTEASAECIECLAGKDVSAPGAVKEVASLSKKLQEETEDERIEREALTYFLIQQNDEAFMWASKIQSYFLAVALSESYKKPLDPKQAEGIIELLGSKKQFDELKKQKMSDNFLEKLVDMYFDKTKSEVENFRKKNKGELRKYLSDAKKKTDDFKKNINDATSSFRKSPVPCDLDNLELLTILTYTGRLYRYINKGLRDHDEDSPEYKKYVPYMQTMQGGLAKLKDYQNVVYRSMNLSPELLELYKPGEVIEYKAYTSTSRHKDFVEGKWGKVGFEIHSKRGKYISPFSSWWNEEEVLIQPGAKLRVLEKIPKGDSWRIKLEEVVD